MWARLFESITREGLDTATELFAPIRVLEIRTVSTPLVAMSAYCSSGCEPFSIHTKWTLLRSSITPVTSVGFDVLRLDMMVCVAVLLSVLLAVSWRLSTGSRNERSDDNEGAKREAIITNARNSVSCFFCVFSYLTCLVGRLYLSWACCRTMLVQRQGAP